MRNKTLTIALPTQVNYKINYTYTELNSVYVHVLK